MIAVGVLDRQGFDAALAHARRFGDGGDFPGLAAPADGSFLGRVAEAWESVERALREAFVHGRDRAQELSEAAVRAAQRCMDEAGRRARDVHQALLGKIQDYLTRLVDTVLGRLRPTLLVGGVAMSLESVDMSQRLALSGSLKAAITEVVSLTAAGELTVSASYRVTPV
ncbi:hypothetical protein [Cellulosimicrobium arenosum]|uniref:Uncharacterized protein n=1 Tax=Cellulosimicrobium arenosum TaxID=2708133 RepID=A0A927G9A2_9MICO|nr:hypothetical protein [Cellulosimicrobium arenosum]MBD8079316.1 hypothetical protein [Cellulosimicrobium arenosum]